VSKNERGEVSACYAVQSDENEGKLVASGSMVFTVFLLV
jgi:hypothetical protein